MRPFTRLILCKLNLLPHWCCFFIMQVFTFLLLFLLLIYPQHATSQGRNVYTHSYNGQNIAVCIGCLFSQRDAHIYCENRHPDAYIYVNIGIGMPILREIRHPGCLFLGVPIFTWHRRPPDQCFAWDSIADPLLAGEKPAYRLYRSMPARTSRPGCKRELRRPENEQILSAVATHCRSALIGIR